MRTMTAAQKGQFWRTFRNACLALGLQGKDEQAEYRHGVMRECCGKEHLNDLNTTTDFEAVMQRLAADAGDYEDALRFAGGDDRRMARMVDDCARQVFELSGRSDGDRLAYVRSILAQSGLIHNATTVNVFWWLDYPDTTLGRIFQMLDTHRRRLVWRRRRETGIDIRIAYSFGTSYKEAM